MSSWLSEGPRRKSRLDREGLDRRARWRTRSPRLRSGSCRPVRRAVADHRVLSRRRLGCRIDRQPRRHVPGPLQWGSGLGDVGRVPAGSEHKYPAAPEDCYAATVWASKFIENFGGDPSRLVVAGDSAGGNLAAVVAMMARDRGGPKLAGQLLLYPITDFSFETASYRDTGRVTS